jgi:hypothetical protein
MNKSIIEEYIESDRFKKFLQKHYVDVVFEENKLSITPKNGKTEMFVEYKFDRNTDTFKKPNSYQLDGNISLEDEIEYPDDLRSLIYKIANSLIANKKVNNLIIYKEEINVEELAAELEEKQELYIENECIVYFIWWSFTNDGWYYEVYHGEIDFTTLEEYQEEGEEIDGGLCTGTEKDAIEMMIA